MSEEDIRSVADKIKLEPHAFGGRTKAVAVAHLSAGSLLVACEAFATVLLSEEKGRRCDYCHRRRSALQKCSACAGYFYCDATCQTLHWGSHKKICKYVLPAFCIFALKSDLKIIADVLIITHPP
jgi:SET and MYND domain-containing protein